MGDKKLFAVARVCTSLLACLMVRISAIALIASNSAFLIGERVAWATACSIHTSQLLCINDSFNGCYWAPSGTCVEIGSGTGCPASTTASACASSPFGCVWGNTCKVTCEAIGANQATCEATESVNTTTKSYINGPCCWNGSACQTGGNWDICTGNFSSNTPIGACSTTSSSIDVTQPPGAILLELNLTGITNAAVGDVLELYEYNYPVGYDINCGAIINSMGYSGGGCGLPPPGGGKLVGYFPLPDLNFPKTVYCKYSPPRDGSNLLSQPTVVGPPYPAAATTDLSTLGNPLAGRYRVNAVLYSIANQQFSYMSSAGTQTLSGMTNNSVPILAAAPPTPALENPILYETDGLGQVMKSCTTTAQDVGLPAYVASANPSGYIYPFLISSVTPYQVAGANALVNIPRAVPAPFNLSTPYLSGPKSFTASALQTVNLLSSNLQPETASALTYGPINFTVTDELATTADVQTVQYAQSGAGMSAGGTGSVPTAYKQATTPNVQFTTRPIPQSLSVINPAIAQGRGDNLQLGGSVTLGCQQALNYVNNAQDAYFQYTLQDTTLGHSLSASPWPDLGPYIKVPSTNIPTASFTDTVTITVMQTSQCGGTNAQANPTGYIGGWLGPQIAFPNANVNNLGPCYQDTGSANPTTGVNDSDTVMVTQTFETGSSGAPTAVANVPVQSTSFTLAPATPVTLSAFNAYFWENINWQVIGGTTPTAATLFNNVFEPTTLNFGGTRWNLLPAEYLQLLPPGTTTDGDIAVGANGNCVINGFNGAGTCKYSFPIPPNGNSSVTTILTGTTSGTFTYGGNTFGPSVDYVVQSPNSFKIAYDTTQPQACQPNPACAANNPAWNPLPAGSNTYEIEPTSGLNPMDNFATTLGLGGSGPGPLSYATVYHGTTLPTINDPHYVNIYFIARCTPSWNGTTYVCAANGQSSMQVDFSLFGMTGGSNPNGLSSTNYNVVTLYPDVTLSNPVTRSDGTTMPTGRVVTWAGNGMPGAPAGNDQIMQLLNSRNVNYSGYGNPSLFLSTNVHGSPGNQGGYDIDQAIIQLCGCN